MEFLEQRLQDLRKQHAQAPDLESAKALQVDIRNVEKALQVDGELRSAVNGPSKPIRLPIVASESNVEFRARAERELAAVREA
jgi:hypothetical protein